MFIKQYAVVVLSLLVALGIVLAACAAPTPTSSPTTTPTSTITPTATPTGPLAQIIEGAKKEGTVSVTLPSRYTPTSIQRLRSEIKAKFGVDLDIKFTPTGNMEQKLAEATMEYKAGATPTYDIMTFATTQVVLGNKAGVFETVDWKPILTADANPEVVPQQPALKGSIIEYTISEGLWYNPDKVRADEVPQTLSDLANPKWKGKIGTMSYTTVYAVRSFILGKDKVFAQTRAILKNGALVSTYPDLYNRYLLGEIWLAFSSSSYMKQALDKGVAVKWQDLDLAQLDYFPLAVRKGAPHPNAAKLLAIYLVTPAGAKYQLEEGSSGTSFYPGNFQYDLAVQAKKQSIPQYELSTYPGLLEFATTDEFVQWQSEISLILKGG